MVPVLVLVPRLLIALLFTVSEAESVAVDVGMIYDDCFCNGAVAPSEACTCKINK